MKNILRLFFFIVLISGITLNANAITVTGNAPVTNDPLLNTQLNAAFLILKTNVSNRLDIYSDMPDLAKGFNNANAYAAQAGTLQGYQNYSLFAVSTGIMLGAQLPGGLNTMKDIGSKIEDEGDLYAGLSAGLSIINVGINAKFLLPGLYLNAKFGVLPTIKSGDFKFKSSLVGIGANYAIIEPKSVGIGLVKWRGLYAGAGIIYLSNTVDDKVSLGDETVALGGAYSSYSINSDPSFILGLHIKTVSIPLDITTAVQLLWVLNLTLGAGLDFNFGKTDIIIAQESKVNLVGYPTLQDGKLIIDGSTRGKSPSIVRARITSGLGFNLGPVKLDIPVTYYLTSGFAVGITAGFVW